MIIGKKKELGVREGMKRGKKERGEGKRYNWPAHLDLNSNNCSQSS